MRNRKLRKFFRNEAEKSEGNVCFSLILLNPPLFDGQKLEGEEEEEAQKKQSHDDEKHGKTKRTVLISVLFRSEFLSFSPTLFLPVYFLPIYFLSQSLVGHYLTTARSLDHTHAACLFG